MLKSFQIRQYINNAWLQNLWLGPKFYKLSLWLNIANRYQTVLVFLSGGNFAKLYYMISFSVARWRDVNTMHHLMRADTRRHACMLKCSGMFITVILRHDEYTFFAISVCPASIEQLHYFQVHSSQWHLECVFLVTAIVSISFFLHILSPLWLTSAFHAGTSCFRINVA